MQAVTSTALVVTPHPVTVQGQRVLDAQQAQLVPGETLAAFLSRHDVLAGQQWQVSIGGIDVPEALWARVRPRDGHLIEARRVPEKEVLRLAATVALGYFTFGAGGIGVGGLFGTGVGAYLAAGAAYIGGSILINKLLGPKVPKTVAQSQPSPTYSLSGGRNRLRPWEPMGLVLGEPYCVPDLASQPYTHFVNGEQYLWQLFHCGINCASVSNIRVGQTAIGNYQGVQLCYDGFASGNTGLPGLGQSVDTVAGALLDAPSSPGPWVTRTSSPNTLQLAIDIEGQLYGMTDKGAFTNLRCDIEIEYRAVGSGTWLKFGHDAPYTIEHPAVYTTVYESLGREIDISYMVLVSAAYTETITPDTIALNNASTRPLRLTFQRVVDPGQYEVRARKVTANTTSSTAQNTVSWSTLKSYQVDNGNYAGQSRLGIQIQASGQLNGALDEVNLVASMKPCPYWNGSAWVTAVDRASGLCNPGALLLLLVRGIYDGSGRLIAGLGWDDSRIDIESFKQFMVRCAACNFYFDYFLQEMMSTGDLLDAIAAAGMGAISFHPGKLSVIWFSEADPVEAVLNMGTFKPKSFSVSYDTMATAEELEVQYFDRGRGNAWMPIRVTAPGVTVPTEVARQQLLGVTVESHAAVMARFVMAQNLYQRKSIGCEVDLEHLTFRRGTVLALSHDLTQWGYGGRLRAVANAAGILTLTLDDLVPSLSPSGGSSRYIGLRVAGDTQYRVFPCEVLGASPSRTVRLLAAWPVGVTMPGDSASNPAHDTLWIYDFKPTPGQKLRVVEISPQGNLDGARIQLVPESPEFWNYVWNGTYAPPPNNSLLRGRPVVRNPVVTEMLRRQGNTFFTELTVNFEVAGTFDSAELWGTTSGNLAGSAMQRLATTRSSSASWIGGLDETWTLEVRPYSQLYAGTPLRFGYQVAGLRRPPANVASLILEGRKLSWPSVADVDLAGYRLKFHYGSNRDWGTGVPMHTGLITESPYTLQVMPSGPVTIMIRAVDTTGNESRASAFVVAQLGDVLVANVVEGIDYRALGWPGEVRNANNVAGDLVATQSDLFYGPDERLFYGNDAAPFYNENYDGMEWVSTPWTPSLAAAGSNMTIAFALTGDAMSVEYRLTGPNPFYKEDDAAFYGPDDELFYEPASPWQAWPGSIVAQNTEYQFRIVTTAGPTAGALTAFSVSVDVPDKSLNLNNVAISAGGTRLSAAVGEFNVIQNIQLTLRGTSTAISAKASDYDNPLGPLVIAVDAANASVAASIDAQLQGY